MERIIKASCILMVVFFVVITVGSMANQDTYAAGGINYTVTVQNPTDSKCKVTLYVNKAIQTSQETVIIEAGGSYTWQTGAYCPDHLNAEYWDKKYSTWRKMQCVNMYGHRVDCGTGLGGVAVCASKKFKVCRKGGQGFEEVRDNDMGFCLE